MAICATCGQNNALVARFCQACGAPMEPEPSWAEERKVVTVLFCDLVGFTSHAEQADPEEVRAMLRAYYARLRQVIEHYSGTVEKFIGDAVVAVFGAPVAHEDDPERALRAAFRILEAIQSLSSESSRPDLAVRIGINTGEAIVSLGAAQRGEGMAAGDVVNTAARFQTFAPVGGIVVGGATYRATLHMVDYEALPPAEFKGKAEPIPVWRAVGMRSRFGEIGFVHSGPMVDRESERQALVNSLLGTIDDRRVRLVTVVGEAGLGKTRLVGELFRFVDSSPDLIYWRHARCLPYGDSFTFWPLAQIVKAHAGILESDGPEVWPEKLDAALGTLPLQRADRDWVRARLGPLLGQGGPGETEPIQQVESFTAWRRFLEAVAAVHPLVLVVEDIHWGDDPMLDFLEHLVMGQEGYPLLILCTARLALFDRRAEWGTRWVNSTVIRLAPLSDEDTRRLLDPTMDPATMSALIERAGGNPLFAQEFDRLLRDRRAQQGGPDSVGPRMEVRVPDSITSIIAARLDGLPARVKSVLQDASVIGKVFWSGTLTAISDIQEGDVLEALRQLSKRELISRLPTSRMQWNEEFAFSHILVREVAYGQIARAARARKHRAVAEWFEQVSGSAMDEPELLAYHYEQALDLGQASGAPVEGLDDRLRSALLAAGDRAMFLDVGRAAGYYRRALDRMTPFDLQRPRALTGFADAAAQAGGFAEAQEAYNQAIDGFRAVGDDVRAGDAMRKLSNLLWHRGDVGGSREVLDGAVQMLERAAPGREMTDVCTEAGWTRMLTGDAEGALAWARRSLDISSRLGLRELRPRALALQGAAQWLLGDPAGIQDVREALNLALDLGLSREAARASEILAEALIAAAGPKDGVVTSRRGIELAEGRGVTYMATAIRALTLIPALVLEGEWATALEEAEAVLSWSREAGGGYFVALTRAHSAHVNLWQGDLPQPHEEDAFLPAAREIGDPQVLVPALAVAAMLRTASDRPEAAHQIVGELISFDSDPRGWITSTYLADLGGVVRDQPSLARALLDRVTAPARLAELGRMTLQAVIEEGEGRLEAAGALYGRAAEGWRSFGAPPLDARCLFDQGRCLLQLGDHGAMAALAQARDRAASLGARGLEVEAAAAEPA